MRLTLRVTLFASLWISAASYHAAFADAPAAVTIHYAPTERLDRIDAALIGTAARSIDIAAYVLSDWGVIDALNAAAARGVIVRVVLDPREHSDTERMAGLQVRMKHPGPPQHLKSYAIDGVVLRTGSENFSHSAPTQDNDLVVVHSPADAARFEAHFAQMWDLAEK